MEQATKKKILIWIAAIAGFLLLLALIWLIIFNAQFKTYKDSVNRFSIRYPGAWDIFPNPETGAAVAFVSKKENALDTFRENVNISIQELPETVSLKALTDTIVLQMTKVFPNVAVAQSLPIDFGNRKGQQILFAVDKPDRLRILTVWTIKGGSKAYILTYMSTAKNYPVYLPFVAVMVKSFDLN